MKRFLAIFLILCTLVMLVACNTDRQQKEAESKPKITNIFLSKSEVTLGIDETINLIATVSPSNIQTTLTWSSSDDTVAEVDSQGTITAMSAGSAVIKVETPNGVVAVCNVEVKIKTGSVTGMVTYKYNSYVGNKPDTNSTVILISKSVTSLPQSVAHGFISNLPNGCYGTKVDGSGNYRFDNVPIGEYHLILISENTNLGSSYAKFYWGTVYNLFSEDDKSIADSTGYFHQIYPAKITVNENQTTTFSHDFGLTYF